MDWSKDRWEQAWERVTLCVFLGAFWPISPSGIPKPTCFYGPAGVRGAQSAVFLRAPESVEFPDPGPGLGGSPGPPGGRWHANFAAMGGRWDTFW